MIGMAANIMMVLVKPVFLLKVMVKMVLETIDGVGDKSVKYIGAHENDVDNSVPGDDGLRIMVFATMVVMLVII